MDALLPETIHPHCFVCSPANRRGLALQYNPSPDGSGVEASFPCDPIFAGYEGQLHGGIVCSVLDGAMVQCLFLSGRTAYTAELTVRFRGAVVTGAPATVRGRIERSRGRLHVTSAELVQDGEVKAVAHAKFLEAPPGRALPISRTPSESPHRRASAAAETAIPDRSRFHIGRA
jgi:acyl-coenzyme A thioesterase PaaI-like protein